jgi:MOSC domain-containing protein YiiM
MTSEKLQSVSPSAASLSLISLNLAVPREIAFRGNKILTGIYKEPVTIAVHAGRLGLAGDLQADLRVHGGPDKAIYAYPSEHYAFWRRQLPAMNMPWGTFGENLTTAGLDEKNVRIGDRFQIGTAIVEVTQPRSPCFKLGTKFGNMAFIKRFRESGRPGFYLSVVQEGEMRQGDAIRQIATGEGDTIANAFKN